MESTARWTDTGPRITVGALSLIVAVSAATLAPLGAPPPLTAQAAPDGGVGHVEFETGGDPAARTELIRGLGALHSFWFEEAIEAFQAAQAVDPDFVPAYWGEVLSYYRPMTRDRDRRESIREVLERLGPTPEARAAKATSPRDRELLAAAERLAPAEGDWEDRKRAYHRAMRRVAERYPDDPEVQIHYAFSIFGVTESFRRGRPEMEELASIARRVIRDNPRHPGGLHYLIHAVDTPREAHRALDAARRYARTAPAAPHAIHMPSHIFVQLGLWEEAEASNRHAYETSVDWQEATGRGVDSRDFHAYSWLPYVLVQRGRYAAADSVVAEFDRIGQELGGTMTWYRSHVIGRHVLETGEWRDQPLPLSQWRTRDELFARAVNALHTGDPAEAESLLAELRAGRDRVAGNDGPQSVSALWYGIAALQLEAILAQHHGRTEEALAALDRAAVLEAGLGAPNELPTPFLPLEELRGEILLEAGHPDRAAMAFEAALREYRARARSLLGLARALEAGGHRDRARLVYARLAIQWQDADPALPALEEVRRGAGH